MSPNALHPSARSIHQGSVAEKQRFCVRCDHGRKIRITTRIGRSLGRLPKRDSSQLRQDQDVPNQWLSLPTLLLLFTAGCVTADPPSTSAVRDTDGQETTTAPTTTAPEPTSTATRASDTCSASNLPGVPSPQADLPDLVAARRNDIVAAAVRCDYRALAEMAAPDFYFSFAFDDHPADYWRFEEESGFEPMRRLVLTLDLTAALDTVFEEGQHIWPSAAVYASWSQVPQEQRDALLALYDAEELAQFEDFDGFIGERVGISPQGEWLFFVAGD